MTNAAIFCELVLEQPIAAGRFRRYILTNLDSEKSLVVEGLYTDGARWRGDIDAFPFDTPFDAWQYAIENTWLNTNISTQLTEVRNGILE